MIHSINNEKYFFEIDKYKDPYTNYNDRFYFYLIDEEGYRLESCSYTQKINCKHGIKSVIRNSKNEFRFEVEQIYDEKWRVYLKAGNGKRIATSNYFGTEEEAKYFIKNLKNLSLKTPVIDNTKIKN